VSVILVELWSYAFFMGDVLAFAKSYVTQLIVFGFLVSFVSWESSVLFLRNANQQEW
jgi:hypothetical protein